MSKAKVAILCERAASNRRQSSSEPADDIPPPSCVSVASHIRREEHPWEGRRVPDGYWAVRENRVKYVRWLGGELGFLRNEQWYNLRKYHFQLHGGGGLFRNEYRSSTLTAMLDYQPEYDWKPWLFGGAPNGFWKVRENRHWYMHWLAAELGITCPEDWYRVTGADFSSHHGGGLLNNQFGASVQAVLLDFVPSYPWMPWKFSSVPQSYWRLPTHRKDYLCWLGGQLGFRTADDWKRLKRADFYKHGGSGLFVSYYNGSTRQAVKEYLSDQTANAL